MLYRNTLSTMGALAIAACFAPVHDSLVVGDETPRRDGGVSRVRDAGRDGPADSSSPSVPGNTAAEPDAAASSSGGASSSSGALDPTDEFAPYRVRCLDRINLLRATRSLAPYTYWSGVESCVDAQASSDEQSGVPHQAWSAGGACNGYGQDECLGQGADGIEACLELMWSEKDRPACSGCDACAASQGASQACPGCEFSVCGHYVNMSAQYFSEVACGFSTTGARGWATQNFR